MDHELRRLRSEAARLAHGKGRNHVRYSDSFRQTAVALARPRIGRGGSVARLAHEMGISVPTLTKWLRPPAPAVVRPVAVTAAPVVDRQVAPRAMLITPRGLRVEGLDRDTLIAVLQALG